MKTMEEIKSTLKDFGLTFSVHSGRFVKLFVEDFDGWSAEDFAVAESIAEQIGAVVICDYDKLVLDVGRCYPEHGNK